VRIIALEYHDIVPDGAWDESGFSGSAAATYKLSIGGFGDHLRALQQSASPIVTSIGGESTERGRTPVILTFDDGGSGYLAAADLLEQHGWRGCVFMTTGCIGQRGFLTASDLRSLQQRGHVIGTHSRSHPARLSALPAPAIHEEWRASVADLQDALGTAVHVGSVPGGYHSREVAEAAAAAGLTTLFTSEPESTVERIDGCAVVGRYTLRRGDRGAYAARLVGNLAFARSAQWCTWNAKKLAKAIGGTTYLRLRKRILER
jgi:peptidoglycan/xylan/chitin deacetylase (PgdA/CDA1 family)